MGGLTAIKDWLSLSEAGRYITKAVGDTVNSADLLALGLERKLVITMDLFNGADAYPCRFVDRSIASKNSSRNGSISLPCEAPDPERLGRDFVLVSSGKPTFAKGKFDLLPDFTSTLDLLHNAHADLTGGRRITKYVSAGLVLYETLDRSYIVDSWDYFPRPSYSDIASSEQEWYEITLFKDDFNLVVSKSRVDELISTLPKGGDSGQGRAAVFEFDPDSSDYPLLLHIAARAWEHAKGTYGGTPKQRILDFLNRSYPEVLDSSKNAIAAVANWNKKGGRPAGND